MQNIHTYQDDQSIILSGVALGFHQDGVPGLPWQIRNKLFAFCSDMVSRKSHRLGASIFGFGLIITILGFVGMLFNKSVQQEIRFHETVKIGPYRIVSQSITQDNLGKYVSEYVMLDIYRGDKGKVAQLFPEKRFYIADQSVALVSASHLTLQDGLSISYIGRNPKTGNPIIKVSLKPLAEWTWVGLGIASLAILFILVSSVRPSLRQLRS